MNWFARKGTGSMMNVHVNRQSGFGLFEVLITIVIVAIGLLGLAAMQATGLRNNEQGYRASQATVLAYDIADRMRANMGGINSYLTASMTLDKAQAAGAVDGCKSTAGCSPAELAQTDLAEWADRLDEVLPGSIGLIAVSGTTYTVSVAWDDNMDGVMDAFDEEGNPNVERDDPAFILSFQP
jgi:type IV pilus assembly protein PilV